MGNVLIIRLPPTTIRGRCRIFILGCREIQVNIFHQKGISSNYEGFRFSMLLQQKQKPGVYAELFACLKVMSDIYNSYFMISICRPHATPCGLSGGSVWQSYDDYQVTPENLNMWKQ